NYTGSFWDLLQPYALFTGITLVLVCLLHGATFLCLKTTGDMRERSWQVARRVAPFTGAAVTGFIIWTHVTAGTTFFLNVIELLAVLAVLAAVWLGLLARAAARVSQLRLTHLALLSLGLRDLKGAAAHVLRLIHFVVRKIFSS